MKPRLRSISVEVDVNLSDIDDDMLVEEMKDRGFTVLGTGDATAPPPSAAERAYYALTDTTPPPVGEFILECAGRVS